MEPLRQLWNGVDTVKVNFGVAWGAEFGKLLEKLEKKKVIQETPQTGGFQQPVRCVLVYGPCNFIYCHDCSKQITLSI